MTGAATDVGMALGHELRIRVGLPLKSALVKRWQIVKQRMRGLNLLPGEDDLGLNQDETPRQQVPPIEPSILWRMKVLIPLLMGYMLGAVLGTRSYRVWKNRALIVPIVFLVVIGVGFYIWAHIKKGVEKVVQVGEMTRKRMKSVSEAVRFGTALRPQQQQQPVRGHAVLESPTSETPAMKSFHI